MFFVHARDCAAALACVFFFTAAHAQSDGSGRSAYVVARAIADDDDNSNTSIEAGLPLGRNAWLYLGAGREESSGFDADLSSDVVSAGGGLGGEHVELTAGYVRRTDGTFEQDDWSFALDWHGERVGLGADLFVRRADAETIASIERRRRTPLSVRIVESLDATGYGVHGDVDVGERLNLFASVMTYDYDDVETNHPLLSRLLFLSGSGVTRDQAFIDQSFGLGATYRFATMAVTVQYFRDEALENHDVTDTAEVALIVLLGEHWSLTPSLGYSDTDTTGGLGYGGLALSYNW